LRSELRWNLAWDLINTPISGFDFGFTSGLIIGQINHERHESEIRFSGIRKREWCIKARGYHDKKNHRKTSKDEDACERVEDAWRKKNSRTR
jgi:hypothetical protein